MNIRATNRNSGFAITELLVVIGIIIILLGILLPVLNLARQNALKVKCASRLRNLAVIIQAYALDYDGFYPYIDNNDPDGVPNGYAAKFGNYSSSTDTDIYKCSHPFSSQPTDSYFFYYPDFNSFYPTNPRNLYYKNTGGATPSGDTGTAAVPVFMCRSTDSYYPHRHGVNVLYSDGHVKWEIK